MNMIAAKKKNRSAVKEMRQALRLKMEEISPGYLERNDKLHTMIRTLTGLRILYSVFYLAMSLLYGMSLVSAFINLLSPYIFYFWYTYMMRSGKWIAFLMLLFRGGSVVYGGISALQMSYWLPYPLLFTVTLAMVLEFTEVIFCLYILCSRKNGTVIRLNRTLEEQMKTAAKEEESEKQNVQ